MNQKLRFAFATVITLISVLWICYCVFCGYIYLKGSELGESVIILSGALTVFIFILLTASFIGVQLIKATDHKFKKYIVWERIFMFAVCPIVFLFAGYFYSHFFTIHAQGNTAKESFLNSVQKAKDIFPEYRNYAAMRINDYSNHLTESGYKKENKVHVLSTRLLPPTLNELEEQCTTWINKDAYKGVTVWNPFLLGNVPYIKKSIENWHQKLYGFSTFKMQNENNVSYFDADKTYIQSALSGLEQTQQIYAQWKFPNFLAILTGLICYIMMMFAYFIQTRNNNSECRLFNNDIYLKRRMELSKKMSFSQNHDQHSNQNEPKKVDYRVGRI